jgi:hypothetical protein
MVLERLFRNKAKDEPLDIDNPYAYSNAYEDCLSCRILGMNHPKEQLAQKHTADIVVHNTGSTALVSLGGYTYFTGMKNLRLQQKAIEMSKSKYKYGSRQLGILTISATLVGMGLYRTFN